MRLVHVGDYVDRGPDSPNVIARLMDMEQQSPQEIINLKGNHELAMHAACRPGADPKDMKLWLSWGGAKTLEAYKAGGFDGPPQSHLDWIDGLPTFHWDKAAKLIFVHAGIEPADFPNDGAQVHMFTRTVRFFESDTWPDVLPTGTKVIHGHTPTQSGKADVSPNCRRINIDTGACYGGDLTALILAPNAPPRFINA